MKNNPPSYAYNKIKLNLSQCHESRHGVKVLTDPTKENSNTCRFMGVGETEPNK